VSLEKEAATPAPKTAVPLQTPLLVAVEKVQLEQLQQLLALFSFAATVWPLPWRSLAATVLSRAVFRLATVIAGGCRGCMRALAALALALPLALFACVLAGLACRMC